MAVSRSRYPNLVQSVLFIPTLDTTTQFYYDNLNATKPLLKRCHLLSKRFRDIHIVIINFCRCSITKTHLFKYIENFTSRNWKFSDEKLWYFSYISAQNIDCMYSLKLPRQGGSNEYPQSMFLNRNKKNNLYPCKPQFYYIKVGFKGVKII